MCRTTDGGSWPARHRPDGSAESGQATVALISAMLIIWACGAALIGLGAEATERSRAQSAADLVALAAVVDAPQAAAIAAANDATIVSITTTDDTVTVVVERHRRRALSAAAPRVVR